MKLEKEKQTDISHYNSFEVFEDIYGQSNQRQHFDELDIPVESQPGRAWNWVLGLVIILVITLAVHPLLSYSLKTPYPLIVIAEDSMEPNLINGDLVLSTGVIDPSQIQVNDIVVFKSISEPNTISVQRVIEIRADKLVLRGDAVAMPVVEIFANQVISKIVGSNNQHPLRIPLIGKLSSFLARI